MHVRHRPSALLKKLEHNVYLPGLCNWAMTGKSVAVQVDDTVSGKGAFGQWM